MVCEEEKYITKKGNDDVGNDDGMDVDGKEDGRRKVTAQVLLAGKDLAGKLSIQASSMSCAGHDHEPRTGAIAEGELARMGRGLNSAKQMRPGNNWISSSC